MTILKKVSLEENISKMAKCSLHDLVKLFCSMFNVVVYVNARTGSVVLSCHAQIGNGLVVYIRLSEYRLNFSDTNTYDKIPYLHSNLEWVQKLIFQCKKQA